MNSHIIQLDCVQAIAHELKNIPLNSILLMDIDDTLITPASRFFRINPYRTLIDEIKRNKHLYPDYEIIISNWRLQRKAMLVDSHWLDLIYELKKQHAVYGFTKMDTGKLGSIESVEDWRYQELKRLGIEFTQNESIEALKAPHDFQNPPVFYKGIFLSGCASKGEMAIVYRASLNAPHLVLIDDREEHILSVKNFCLEAGISFKGILFNAEQLIPSFEPNSPIAEFQKNYLLQQKKWIEDEEVQAYL